MIDEIPIKENYPLWYERFALLGSGLIYLQFIPDYMHRGLLTYIERGLIPGSFLTAVLNNDLLDAVRRADDKNVVRLHCYGRFLLCAAPREASGSPEQVKSWKQRGGLAGKQPATTEQRGTESMNPIVDTVYFATGISLAMACFYCFTWATALAVGSELGRVAMGAHGDHDRRRHDRQYRAALDHAVSTVTVHLLIGTCSAKLRRRSRRIASTGGHLTARLLAASPPRARRTAAVRATLVRAPTSWSVSSPRSRACSNSRPGIG